MEVHEGRLKAKLAAFSACCWPAQGSCLGACVRMVLWYYLVFCPKLNTCSPTISTQDTYLIKLKIFRKDSESKLDMTASMTGS